MTYDRPDDIIERLSETYPAGFDLSLNRVRGLLQRLGDPQRDCPPFFHVAGTNGKGSTIAFLRAMLESAGYSVHTHTSPHLVRYNERFRLATGAGKSAFVDDDTFAQALLRVERVNDGEAITVFELLTATAFVLFSSHPADYTLLEVGLGGRLDATNVIDQALVSIITPISLDHKSYLGETVEKIAAEKAGIIKRNSPVVVGPQISDRVHDVIDYAAARAHTDISVHGTDWMATTESGRFIFQDEEGLLDLSMPKLRGRHQIVNAGAAIKAIRAANISIENDAIDEAFQNVQWPGRMQKLNSGPLVEQIMDGAEVWLDGGHNPDAGTAISAAMADLEDLVSRPLYMIVGMLNTKEAGDYFRPFGDLVRHIFTVPLSHTPNFIPPDDLANIATNAGLSAQPMTSVEEAIASINQEPDLDNPPRILISGSLYLVGEVLERNESFPE